MHKRSLICLLLLFGFLTPLLSPAQIWKRTVTLKDRREGGETPAVAKAELSAYYMNSRLAPGDPIKVDASGNALPILYPQLNEGYIKIKIDNITWTDENFDKSSEYKVVVRSLWVDMKPRIWQRRGNQVPGKTQDQLRRSFINAPNVEYVFGDSMPPPFIFKLNESNRFTFQLGFKVLTPETDREKPFPETFSFGVQGLPPSPDNIDTGPAVVEVDSVVIEDSGPIEGPDTGPEEPVEDPTADIAEAVDRAVEAQDVDALISLIRDYPDVQAVKDARDYLSLNLRRELVDSVEYKIDIEFQKFSRALPTRSQVDISFQQGGRELTGAAKPYSQWRDDKLFVRPPRNGRDYMMIASIKATPDLKARINLNSVRDFIRFTYYDTLETEAVALKIQGGQGPYRLHLERSQDGDFFEMEGSVLIYGDTILNKENLARALPLSDEGDYRLFLVDDDQLKKTGRTLVHITPPPPIPPIVWYASLGGLLLLFVGYRFWVAGQRRKDEELEKLIAARGGLDPKVKRKPKPDLVGFWNETSISDLSLHQGFIDEIAVYLRERKAQPEGAKSMIEGVILGTVLKFDFENEQYEVRLDKFRAIPPRALDHYHEAPDREKWMEIKEVIGDHRDLVKIGWLQVVEDKPMRLGQDELNFQDEQFSELFQLCLKIDIEDDRKRCGFFTRTISGKVNNEEDRREGVEDWMDWDKLEDAGYYETKPKPVKQASDTGISIKNVNEHAEWA